MYDIKKILKNINAIKKLSPTEWDAICANCGMCCLTKIRDESDNCVYYSNFSCANLNLKTKKCNCYETRLGRSDCQKITLDMVIEGKDMPDSCAYVERIFGTAKHRADIDWDKTQSVAELCFENYDKIFNDTIASSVYWSARYNFGDEIFPGYKEIKSEILKDKKNTD